MYSFIVTKNWCDTWITDPYGHYNHRDKNWGIGQQISRSLYIPPLDFDWSDDIKLNHSYDKVIIYEMHVVYIILLFIIINSVALLF